MGKVIAICNQKGGTGKTTTSISLSSFLALAGKKILLIDIDPQGNATSGLGIDRGQGARSIYSTILNQTAADEIIMPTQVSHLHLIPSSLDLTGAEVELVGTMGREYKLKQAISGIREMFDIVFIDCPPSLGLLTVNALSAANSVLIPIQCEYYALEGLSQLLRTIELIKEHLNPAIEIEGVLLTMADHRTKLTREVIEEARTYFKDKVYQTVIPRNVRLAEAPSFGKPIGLYDKDSLGAQSYQELCNEFLGIKKQEQPLRPDIAAERNLDTAPDIVPEIEADVTALLGIPDETQEPEERQADSN